MSNWWEVEAKAQMLIIDFHLILNQKCHLVVIACLWRICPIIYVLLNRLVTVPYPDPRIFGSEMPTHVTKPANWVVKQSDGNTNAAYYTASSQHHCLWTVQHCCSPTVFYTVAFILADTLSLRVFNSFSPQPQPICLICRFKNKTKQQCV